MKAAFIESTGPASCIQYGEVPTPTPDVGQVLVRTGAVAVNPIDTYIRSGNVKAELPTPYIVGCDIAGTVAAVGDGVTEFQPGDRVWGSNQGLAGRQGTFAEFAAIDQSWLYPTPPEVSDEVAAAISLTGITAHLGLHLHGGLQQKDVVFVNGGTGGVGSAVVQIAKASGATVLTTAGSAEKVEQARTLGADVVINYRDTDVVSALERTIGETGPINLWFETLRTPTPETTFPLLAKRGRYVLMAGRDARPEFPIGPFYVKDLRAIGFAMFNASAAEQREAATQLNQLLAARQLQPLIGARFPLSEAAAAHQLQEDNTLQGAGTLSGKIVLNP
ncbi:MAG: NADPH:quinone reductase [Fuerstiella sp.]